MMPTEEMAGMVDDNFPTRMLTRERDRFVIGRDNDCAIVVRDASLSRQHGAVMPSATTLAAAIKDISYLNAINVRSGRDFHADMNSVIATISRYGIPQCTVGAA